MFLQALRAKTDAALPEPAKMRESQDKEEALRDRVQSLEKDLHTLKIPLSLFHSADGVQGGGRLTPASRPSGNAENETEAADGFDGQLPAGSAQVTKFTMLCHSS